MTLENRILHLLKAIPYPLSQKDIVESGVVQSLVVTPSGKATLILEIDTQYMTEGQKLKQKAEELLGAIPEVKKVQVILTSQRKPKVHNPSKQTVPGVKHIIAVASGKGGVGKSTTAVNLACALQRMGLKVGILDGDIYGPSLPHLLGVLEKPTSDDGKMINPIYAHGLTCMSLGFMSDKKTPALWRGVMVQNAFSQILRQVKWGELDILVIDLPPGTGDVHLTLVQTTLVSGAVIVSTPQDLALIDARKGLEMFLKVEVPVLGLIENMSYFLCPHCDKRAEIFEHGGVLKEAESLNLPLLAEIPLHMSIREASEKGLPIVLSEPESSLANVYEKLGERIWKALD